MLSHIENLVQVEQMFNGIGHSYVFENGYGASVVSHDFSMGGRAGLWELDVLEVISTDPLKCSLAYVPYITEGVLGYLNNDQVEIVLNEIQALPRRK